MNSAVVKCLAIIGLLLVLSSDALAVRIMTLSDDALPAPVRFDNFVFAPDGNTVIATGQSLTAGGDRVFSFPLPANPLTDTVTATQLSTRSFAVNSYDVAFAPTVSPNGQQILFTHDGSSTSSNSIYTMPITGEAMNNSFTGLFGPDPNNAAPGHGSSHPVYSPDGATIYFINDNSGFGGSVPIFPTSPTPWAARADWDQLYSVPAAGGTPTAVTAPGDGDIDAGLFALTPDGSSIVYAPDNPIRDWPNRGAIRPKLFTIASTGGAPAEIPFPAPAHDFTIGRQLEVTADGQTVLFIADYESIGKFELFSLPITGGTPTRINDELPWSGDVNSFAVAPNGTSIAYVAGQNTSANHELFLKSITGAGTSIRVSDPAPSNSGLFDVSNSIENGQLAFSQDSSQLYYLGDFDTEGTNDLYVVDTSEKTGLVPSPYYFVGASGGDFFDESNWNDMPDGTGNSPPAGTIDPAVSIYHSLIVDGDTVGKTVGEVDFVEGGSLELLPGSVLNFTTGGDFDFNPGSGFKQTDATVHVVDDAIFEGTTILSGGLIESGDDIEFQDAHNSSIVGTILRATTDNIFFENSATSVTGATLESSDRIGMRYEVDVRVVDSTITVRGESSQDPGGPGHGDIEDAFNGAQGAGSTLILEGASTLLANAFQDGVSLMLAGTSVATLRNDPGGHPLDPVGGFDVVDAGGEIIFMSTGAELITTHGNANDVRDRIINGLTGLSYLDDPTAWNVVDWNGLDALASLQLIAAALAGDYDNDGIVGQGDLDLVLLNWGDNAPPVPVGWINQQPNGVIGQSQLDGVLLNWGNTSLAAVAAVPEPSAILLIAVGGCLAMATSRKVIGGGRTR